MESHSECSSHRPPASYGRRASIVHDGWVAHVRREALLWVTGKAIQRSGGFKNLVKELRVNIGDKDLVVHCCWVSEDRLAEIASSSYVRTAFSKSDLKNLVVVS